MAEAKADYAKYILPVAGVAILFAAAQKFHLIPTSESRAAEAEAATFDSLDYFKPDYAKQYAAGKGWSKYLTHLLKQATAAAYGAAIYNAVHFFKNDRDAVYTTFKRLRYKAQVAQLAEKFVQEYNTDLVTYLKSFMDEQQQSRIINLVKDLPAGVEKATT